MSRVFPGAVGWLIVAAVVFINAYVAAVVVIAVESRDFFSMLLAALTVLPLMLLLVFTPPNPLAGICFRRFDRDAL